MTRGITLDVTPEDREVLANVVFEDLLDEGIDDRRVWMVEAALDVLASIGHAVRGDDIASQNTEDELYVTYDTKGEELFWQAVEREVLDAGYDVYNSDSLFEVYEPVNDGFAAVQGAAAYRGENALWEGHRRS